MIISNLNRTFRTTSEAFNISPVLLRIFGSYTEILCKMGFLYNPSADIKTIIVSDRSYKIRQLEDSTGTEVLLQICGGYVPGMTCVGDSITDDVLKQKSTCMDDVYARDVPSTEEARA